MEASKREELKAFCEDLILQHPEAMGIAYMELDCGCINSCGVSAKGDPVGEMQAISGYSQKEDTVCLKCYRDKKIDWSRIIDKGLIWPGEDSERPDEKLRMAIGKRVFGPDYTESLIPL